MLYETWSPGPVTFADLARSLHFPEVEQVKFGFNPDWLGVEHDLCDYADSAVFVRGDLAFPERAILPPLART